MEPTDINWLHLSDFHLGKDDYGERRILKYILSEVDEAVANERTPDFVFVTGDLANKGRADEYKSFDQEFIVPLIDKLGDTYFDRIFIVPGNHDVDRTKARAVGRYGVLDEVPNFLDPTEEGRAERKDLLPRFSAFDQHAWYLDYPKWVCSTEGISTRRVEIKNFKIGILSINTAWFCRGDNDQGKLSPGLEMIEHGLDELKDCQLLFVLGHHPLDWFIPSHAQRIIAQLGRAGAIYLHGHFHKSQHLSFLPATRACVSLQAGCAFYSRDDDQWLTRLLWGGFEFQSGDIRIQPKKWVPNHHEWAVDTDAIPNSLRVADRDYWSIPTQSLRTSKEPSAESHRAVIAPPEGWLYVDAQFLADRRQPVSEERVLQYFEGRVPQWEDILSESIPARSIVDDLVSSIYQGIEGNEGKLTVLLGAGGEGKSTAFLQTLNTLISKYDISVLWRTNSEKPMPFTFVQSLAASKKTWLLASDEGDSLIRDTFEALQGLRKKSNIHVFLACRDTDWIENHGNDIRWNDVVAFTERRMKGLDESDARKIVTAWSRYGSRGLGKLANSSIEDSVHQLVEAARVEASTSDGAFLGAMLRVRIGLALKDHVAALLMRLHGRGIVGLDGKTLLDSFALISVPHAYNVLFLSKSVLARALDIEESKVRRRVLGPLGEEAAAGATGQFILTRHRAIAEAATEIISNRFDIDPEDVLAELVRAALKASNEGALVPHLSEWRYLSSRFFNQGNQSLGVRLAAVALATDPTNSFFAVKLAQLYREAGQAEQSANVFRKSDNQNVNNRAYYTEWATCEGLVGNRALSVWLSAVSLADETDMRPADVRDIGFGLAGCLVNFTALYERYQNTTFLDAAIASACIARRISLPKVAFDEIELREQDLSKFADDLNMSPSLLMQTFEDGVQRAYLQREIALSPASFEPSELSYGTVREIARLRQ